MTTDSREEGRAGDGRSGKGRSGDDRPAGDRAELGLVSDTHGLLRAEVFEALDGVEAILHAGDVGDPAILVDLEALAPVDAVWGNMDAGEVRLRTSEVVERDWRGIRIAVIHGHQVGRFEELLDRFPGVEVIVHGHSHLPTVRRVGSSLLVNPGSAGPRRPGKPVTLARLRLEDGRARVRHLDLAGPDAPQPWHAGQK